MIGGGESTKVYELAMLFSLPSFIFSPILFPSTLYCYFSMSGPSCYKHLYLKEHARRCSASLSMVECGDDGQ
ncbi:hypothetical protein M513_13056 [Trichuris suis]|uniref:Uncharacterized protein n=1 Tax=Trichuris suis TaxID=68888 RepID=A0A085LM74_9BILA|nr:hypothetical protein M513_13056 [Trichuris suis]